MRRAAKVDANHGQIVRTLEACGCTVVSLAAVGNGCPDVLAGRGGANYLLEIKSGKGQARASQIEFLARWRGAVVLVRTPEEALRAVGLK